MSSKFLRFASQADFERFQQLRKTQAAAAAPGSDDKTKRRANKFNAQQQGAFDSIREKKRYETLRVLESAGTIRELRHHVLFPIEVHGVKIGAYEADFTYEARQPDGTWKLVVEDAKGYRRGAAHDLWRWKARLMLAVHRIDVREV